MLLGVIFAIMRLCTSVLYGNSRPHVYFVRADLDLFCQTPRILLIHLGDVSPNALCPDFFVFFGVKKPPKRSPAQRPDV